MSHFMGNLFMTILHYQQFLLAQNSMSLCLKGILLLERLDLDSKKEEQIIFHIYCGGRYKYLSKWCNAKEEKKAELNEVKNSIKTGMALHPFSKKLNLISDAIKRAYLQLGLNEELEDPELPDFL